LAKNGFATDFHGLKKGDNTDTAWGNCAPDRATGVVAGVVHILKIRVIRSVNPWKSVAQREELVDTRVRNDCHRLWRVHQGWQKTALPRMFTD
jgi:hypothetical protein